MRAEALPSTALPRFLMQLNTSFKLYMYTLSPTFLSPLCSLPSSVKQVSKIFLAVKEINKKAARRLISCGYRWIYFVPNLHAKLLVTHSFVLIGSANLSHRAVEENYEVVIVIWAKPSEIKGLEKILRDIEVRGTLWRYILQ